MHIEGMINTSQIIVRYEGVNDKHHIWLSIVISVSYLRLNFVLIVSSFLNLSPSFNVVKI